MTPPDNPHGQLSRMLGVLRRPLLGPLLFGLVFAGIPFGIMFNFLGDTVISANLFGRILDLTPAAIVVATLSAVLDVNSAWQHILWRASFTSFAACVPVPTTVCTELALHSGHKAFSANNLPILIILFVVWAVAVTIPSWLFALGYALLKNRRSRRVARA
jgi:hypothetical protein